MIDFLNEQTKSSNFLKLKSSLGSLNTKSDIGDCIDRSDSYCDKSNNLCNNNNHMNSFRLSASKLERRMSQKDTKKRMLKIHMGEPTDDTHECIRCLRAIMSHQYGLHVVIAHKNAINSIALCLKHKQFRYCIVGEWLEFFNLFKP